jgi:23S rRNA (uracil1939-C5)-methyltransferase
MSELTLRIEKLVWRGRGLAREESGRVVLIEPPVLPGELVLARPIKQSRDVIQAEAVEILEPSPWRRANPCGRAAQCGGCLFGVAPNRRQLALKADILRETLGRSLPSHLRQDLPEVRLLATQQAWRYRYRTQVHVIGGRPHFMGLGGNCQVRLTDCLLLARPLARSLESLSAGLPDGRFTLAASPADGKTASERDDTLLDFPIPRHGIVLRLPASVFFQANWRLNLELIDLVTGLLPDARRVVDLFSGAGNFALPLAAQGRDVLAVESHAAAVRCGIDAASHAGIETVRFRSADLRSDAPWSEISRHDPQAVVADPPRSGSGPMARRLAAMAGLRTILWISCDVVNTCRDIAPLLEHGWRVDSLHLADMFPQTWHMEVVFVLKKA